MEIIEEKVAVVCHDAGAANLLIPWLKQWSLNVVPFMQGPAIRSWQSAFPDISLCDSLDEALNGASRLISGTGWASSLEHDARVLAHSMGIRSTAVLDHWVNYKARFERGNSIQFPDELWVSDEWAMQIAREELPQIPVRQFDNLYLQAQVAQISTTPANGTVLYVLEPVRQNWGRNQEGEHQALNFALEHIDSLCTNIVKEIVLRPHPSESLDKYSRYAALDSRVKIDSSLSLAQSISIAELVVGVESFALIVALVAGRVVYSSLPPWAPALRLPHSGIRQIRHLN
jgi:hypothetical protein